MSEREYFRSIRKRLGMYVGEPTLRGAEAFLVGYDQAARRGGAPGLEGWRDWMLGKLDGPCSHVWSGIAVHVATGTPCRCTNGSPDSAADEDAAIDVLFRLLDEYLAERDGAELG